MNCGTAYAENTINGYVGRFRLDWRTEDFPVRAGGKAGPIEYFGTAAEAECAAWRIKDKIETARMVRGGERLQVISKADALFPGLVRQRGKTKAVLVERRARG